MSKSQLRRRQEALVRRAKLLSRPDTTMIGADLTKQAVKVGLSGGRAFEFATSLLDSGHVSAARSFAEAAASRFSPEHHKELIRRIAELERAKR